MLDRSPLEFPHFTVLRASAGSGKTYALARRFVFFLLSGSVPMNRLSNLLAITFSNNAAREMKERILALLKQLALGDRAATEEFSLDLQTDASALRRRAAEVIEEVLSRYSDLQVKTIDSFMTTIFKASAIDFGYNPDFEILMSNEGLMAYAFELFLRRVREGTDESRLMADVIDIIVENQTGEAPYPWDASRHVLNEIGEIYRKIASRGKPVSRVDYSGAAEEVKREICDCLEELERLIAASSLKRNRASSYANLLEDARAGRFADLIERGTKTLPFCKPGEEEYEASCRVAEQWEQLGRFINAYTKLFACSYYAPYLRTYEAFSAILERVKKREGKIFIEDVNNRLASYLETAVVPDVYFRLGEAIFHYLIDEFQDTSPIQWRNLLPLIENSLSQGGSLFVVGDTKQAIYAFRDADYRIMRGVEAKNPFPSASQRIEELHTNYRSEGAIVAFSEHVFQRVLSGLSAYRTAGEESGLLAYAQTAQKGRERAGFVETCILSRNDREPPEKEKVCSLIDALLKRGRRLSDIAILAPRNDDVVKVTTWLNAQGIPFVSYSSLDVRRRKIAGEIISLLTFLDSPLDDLSFATFILGDALRAAFEKDGMKVDHGELHELCFRNRFMTGRPLYKAFQEEMGPLWDRYFDRLFRLSGYLPLYDLVVELYRAFDVFKLHPAEEAALARILEVVKDLEAAGGSTLRHFLEFALLPESDEADWNIGIPHEIDAVKVMTVHKSKGLGFPVVILLLYGERNRGFPYILQEDAESVTLLRLKKGMLRADDEFEKRYREEDTKALVSRLNSLYVAFTRAGAELYVVGIKGERDVFPFALIEDKECARIGTPPEVVARAPRDEAASVGGFHHSLGLDGPPPSTEPLRLEEKRRGEMLHKLLSLVTYLEGDIGSQLDELARAMEAESRGRPVPEDLKKAAARFLADHAIAPWYERRPGRTVRVEQEAADSRGRLFRIDRVVVDAEAVTLFEFKSGRPGAESEKHVAQMANYLKILGEVYKDRPLDGVIAYVEAGEIRRVKASPSPPPSPARGEGYGCGEMHG